MTTAEIKKMVIGGMILRLTFDGALQRSKIYRQNISDERRKQFRDYMSSVLPKVLNFIQTRIKYSDKNHYKTIERFSNQITEKFKDILTQRRLRIGNAQKFINLYWKVAWLIKKTSVKPIHCPFDSIVMKRLPKNVRVPWTQFDSIDEYQKLVESARAAATVRNHKSMADWEMEIYWNAQNGNKKLNMISKSEFVARIKKLKKSIPSKSGNASYTKFNLSGKILEFKRVNTGEYWELNIDELYAVYKSNKFINTAVVKNTTGGRVNSPSVAILMAIDCINQNGNRIT